MNALWHDGNYYLLPDGETDAAGYLKTAAFARPVRLPRLIAENAYAPCFELGKSATEEVTIDPDLAAPVDIELVSREELDRRILQAEAKCAGCRWRGGPGARDLKRCPCLDLSPACPLRETGFDPGFKFYSDAFWRRIGAIRGTLLDLCRKGRFQKAAKLVDRLRFSIPDVFVAFNSTDGKPVMMFSGGGNDYLSLLGNHLVDIAPESVRQDLDLISAFPKGTYRRLDRNAKDAMERRPPLVVATPAPTFRPRFDLTVVVAAAHKETAQDDAYLYLTERIGEHRLIGAMNSIRFVDDSGFDLDYHEKVIDLEAPGCVPLSAEAYDRTIDEAYAQAPDRSGLEAPLCFYEHFDITNDEPVGDLSDVKYVRTRFWELDQCLLFGRGGIIDDVFQDGVLVGRIALELGMDDRRDRDRVEKISAWLWYRLLTDGGAVPYATLYGMRRTIFHFLVTDKRIVRNTVRSLSPLLAKHRATYAEIGPDMTSSTVCGYRLDLPESN